MKTSIIFGHSSGLGHQVTKHLIAKGYKLIGFARSESSLKSKMLTNIKIDLSEKGSIDQLIKKVKSQYSAFDSLIFCAGKLTAHKIDSLNYEEMQKVFII